MSEAMDASEIDAAIEAARERAGEPPGPVTPAMRTIFAAGYEAATREPWFSSPPWFAQYTRANMEAQALKAKLK